jgi:SAM-dependent methyltransferase
MATKACGDPGAYGAAMADVYDDWFADVSDVDATVDRIVAWLASGPDGPVLELGIGTGRLALPLAARDVDILGVDGSPEMVARLRRKPGGADLRVTIGDMVEPNPAGPFALVFAAYNTFFNLTTENEQQQCFNSVAQRLVDGGRFVIEAFVPDAEITSGPNVSVRSADPERVVVSVSRVDAEVQTIDGEYIEVTASAVVRRPWKIRWSTPEQLDAMASRAGLNLESRCADWSDVPCGTPSSVHVSSYRKAAR